jgi:hypothetical protein
VTEPVYAVREKEIVALETGVLNPLSYGITSLRRYLKLDRPLSLLLHDHGSRCHSVAMLNISHTQLH